MQLYDQNLVELLKEVNRNRILNLSQEKIQFVTISKHGEIKDMLIKNHDLNFNKVMLNKMKSRFRNNKEWIET